MRPDKKPKMLYRKVNTRARGVWHHKGGDYRHERNTKQEKNSDATHGSMHGKKQRGLDYTPLFKFLMSKVGQNWDKVYKEAAARLDRPEPIYWMVARDADDMTRYFATGNAYFSRLFVDEDGVLAVIDPDLKNEDMWPGCECCTHTFNGTPFKNPWVWGRYTKL